MRSHLEVELARAAQLSATNRPADACVVLSELVPRAEQLGELRLLALTYEALGLALQRAGRHDDAAKALQSAFATVQAWENETDDEGPQVETQVCLAARMAIGLATSLWSRDRDRAVALATYATQRLSVHLLVESQPADEVRMLFGRAWLLLSGMYEATSAELARLYAQFALTVMTPPAPLFTELVETARTRAGTERVAPDEWRCVLDLPQTLAIANPFGGRIARRRERVRVDGAPRLLDVVDVQFADEAHLEPVSISRA